MPHPAYHLTDHGDALLRAVEAAGQVRSRQQLFLWLRLHLHRFVPHDLLLCLPGRVAGALQVRGQVFNSIPMPAELVVALESPENGFWFAVQQAWANAGREPMELPLESLPESEEAAGLAATGFTALTVHGVDLAGSGVQPPLLLVFAQLAAGDPSWRAVGLQLCLPQIYFAFQRAFMAESQSQMAPQHFAGQEPLAPLLTARELQVLRAVRSARSNIKIGEQLGISALTVKNHLRKIMRKLGAKNRVQAVAEGMARRIID